MKNLLNKALMGIVLTLLSGLALIAIVVELIEGPGKEAINTLFDQAVTEISSELK